MTSCLVTGAAGFIGYHLCEALVAKGTYVLGVDNLNDYYDPQLKRDRLSRLRTHPNSLFIRLDLSDREAVAALFNNARFDSVFHLAAQAGVRYSIENPQAYVDSNLVAFVNVLEGCRHSQSPHLVFASSTSVYGANGAISPGAPYPADRPLSLCAATKRANELLASAYSHLYGLNVTGLRFFTVYGPWGRPDMAIYKFTRAMLAGEPVDLFNHGEMRRDFTYIDDAVAGIVRAAHRTQKASRTTSADFRLYDIGSNHPVGLRALIGTLEECLGVPAKLRMHGMQPGDVAETRADIDTTTRDLGFRSRTSLREGLERFVAWYREYHRDRLAGCQPAALSMAGPG